MNIHIPANLERECGDRDSLINGSQIKGNLCIKEILFWLFLIISVILVFWYILGDSPSEFIAIISIIAIVVIKLWAVSDRLIRLEMKSDRINERIKHSFSHIKEDMNLLKDDMSLIKKMLKRSLNNS